MFSFDRSYLSVLAICLIFDAVAADDNSPGIESWFLEDGTEVFLLEDHRAPLVSVEINFPVNTLMPWIIENDGETAFECQMMDPGRQLVRKGEKLGISLSASMGWGRARIGGSSLVDDFEALIALVSETIRNREYSKEEVRKWHRERVLEWRSFTTNPSRELRKTSIQLLYPDELDPRNALYSKPRDVSTNSSKLSIVRDAILKVPGRNIAVSGDTSRQQVNELLEGLLPPVSDSQHFRDRVLDPQLFGPQTARTVRMDQLNQVYLALVRDSVSPSQAKYPHYSVVNQILGGSFSSRLYQKLRHESGDTYSATLSHTFTTVNRRGMLSLETYTRVDNASVAEQKLQSVLANLHENGVSTEEVRRAVSFLKGREVFARETPAGIVNQWAVNRMNNLPGDFRMRSLNRAATLSIEEINEFVREFYDPDKFAMVRVVPEA